MNTSIFIAQFLAVVYLIFGLGFLLNRPHYLKMVDTLMKDVAHFYWGGILALSTGFLIVFFHNIWAASWVTVITVLGWLALAKGFMLIVFPQVMVNWTKMLMRSKTLLSLWGALILAIGLFFGYYGFLA